MFPEASQSHAKASKIYRFDGVELDLARYELRRGGKRLHLARIPMELLICLVEQHGRLVTREEIIRHLWREPDAIDVVQGLNSAVKRVRDLLNDDPSKPRFIQTVIGKGYRFIASVEELSAESVQEKPIPVLLQKPAMLQSTVADPVSIAAFDIGAHANGIPRGWFMAGAGVLALLLVGGLLFHFRNRFFPISALRPMLQMTTNQSDDPVIAGSISKDGRNLAYADAGGLYLRTLSGRTLALRAPDSYRTTEVQWYPDGRRLLLSGRNSRSERAEVWIVYLDGAAPKLIREDATNAVPSPDGIHIAFTNAAETQIFVGKADGRDPVCLLTGSGRDSFPVIVWSSSSSHLLYERRHFTVTAESKNRFGPDFEENYSWICESVDINSRQTTVASQEFRIDSACSPHNGRMLFSVNTGGQFYLKEVSIDVRTNKLILPPRALRALGTSYATSLSCSADNSTATAVLWRGQPDTYTAEWNDRDYSLRDIHRLTLSLSQDYPHAWSPDSRAIIFESDRPGRYSIYKQAIDENTAEPIVRDNSADCVLPQVSPDGRWILYASVASGGAAGVRTLMRVPLRGGKSERVPIGGALDEFRCPLDGMHECVLRETSADREFIYYALDPITGKGKELARRKWSPSVLGDWDVSPDGCQLAIPSHDPSDTRIALVPLRAGSCAAQPGDVVLKGVGALWSTIWSADGKGLFVAIAEGEPKEMNLHYRGPETVPETAPAPLLYSDLSGHTHLLRKTRGITWAVPSPDGKHIAFWETTPDQNIWRVK